MTFLAGSFLFATVLGAIPLLVHLFARQKVREVNWAAFQFLMGQDAAKSARSMRLTDLLLLLVRTLAILALVFAFAQPLLNQSWFSGERRELVLIIDASLSMAAKVRDDEFGEPQSAMQLAKSIAAEEINKLSRRDQLRVLVLAGRPNWLTDSTIEMRSGNRQAVIGQISAIDYQTCGSNFNDALRTVLRTPCDDRCGQRQVVFITDGTQAPLGPDAESELRQLQHQVSNATTPTRVAIRTVQHGLPATNQTSANIFVQSVRPERDLVATGESARILVEIHNSSPKPSPPSLVKLFIDKREVGATQIGSLDGKSTRTTEFRLPLKDVGFTKLTVRLTDLEQSHEENLLQPDDEATCLIRVVEPIPILVVDGSSSQTQPRRDESGFFITALGGENNGKQLSKPGHPPLSAFLPTVIGPDEAPNVEVDRFAAVAWLNAALPHSGNFQREVAQLLKTGGGFWLVLGNQNYTTAEEREHTAEFLNLLGWRGLELSALRNLSEGKDAEVRSSNVLLSTESHPVTRLFEQADIQANQLTVTSVALLDGLALAPADTLLALSDSNPLLVSQRRTRGRVLVQTFGLNRETSNLPLLPLYVPLVQESLGDLVSQRFPHVNFHLGAPVRLPITMEEFAIAHPDGEATPSTASERLQHSFRRTRVAGLHGITVDGKLSSQFYAARDPQESLLEPLNETTRQALTAAGFGWQDLPPQQRDATARSRLAEFLIACGVILLLLEALFAALRMANSRRLLALPQHNLLGEIEAARSEPRATDGPQSLPHRSPAEVQV